MSEQKKGGRDGKTCTHCAAYLYELMENCLRAAVCVCVCFSDGKGEEAVGKSKREKRAKGLEGKPPAEERRALGPETMKERGFDNFLQSPSKRYKCPGRRTQPHTLAISRGKHPVSEEFLRRHSDVHLPLFLFFFFNSTSLFS